jgi:hypothetical protein
MGHRFDGLTDGFNLTVFVVDGWLLFSPYANNKVPSSTQTCHFATFDLLIHE